MSQSFTSGGQSIGASASVFPVNIQGWFPLGLTGLVSLQSKGFSEVSRTTVQNHQFFGAQPSLWSSSHIPYMTTGKTIVLTTQTLVGKVMSLLLNMLSWFVIAFLAMGNYLLISWLNFRLYFFGLQNHHRWWLQPWKKVNSGLYSQTYVFSSSHVWMWELDHKEGWAPKNWYFQTMVL